MGKKLAIVLILLILALSALYLFIPKNIHVAQAQYLSIPQRAAIRCFNDSSKLKEWLPAGSIVTGDKIEYNGLSFALKKIDQVAIEKIILTVNNGDTITTFISPNSLRNDSSYIYWECNLTSGFSPVSRISKYQEAKKIKSFLDSILYAFANYANQQKNIYGIAVEWVRVVDSVLISEKKTFPVYPESSQLYEIINSLKGYIHDQHAEETGLPMINLIQPEGNNYNVMAAIPISKTIPETDSKKIKRVLHGGNLLMTQVKGGASSINKAFQKLEEYKEDYNLQAPAIPYQSLVTDRIKITDTTEWVTKIYYPFY